MNAKSDNNGVGFDFCAFLDYDNNPDVCLYEIGSYKCIPDYSYGPIVRPRGIIHYVISGKGKLVISDKEYDIHAGQIFLIPAGVSAYYKADTKDPWSYLWTHLGGTILLEILRDSGIDEFSPVKDILPIDGQNVFTSILKDIFDNYQREYYCIGKMYEMIDYFKQTYIKENTAAIENLQLKYVKTVIKYIQLKYSEQLKVESIASTCGLNRSYLSRLFKDATGSTIQDYLLSYRMKTAENMLLTTSNSIQYIAYAVGYNDIFTFSKAFKKHVGSAPSDYRKNAGL